MNQTKVAVALAAVGVLVTGCSGLPATKLGHKCGIPEGIGCMGTQEVFNRTVTGDLPGLQGRHGTGQPVIPSAPSERGMELPLVTDDGARVLRTSALYAPPEELRIWVNRWRDKDGDLHDSSFMYVLIGEGQWMVRD